MIPRILTLPQNHSFFLFGPRGVGKTSLLQARLPKEQTHYIDLLDFETETNFLRRPREFKEVIEALPSPIRWVVIDEVQKIPQLLDEVHRSIEREQNRFFAMTGSSARKLKRSHANLLAGRAFTYALAPFTTAELQDQFNLDDALAFGTLPKIFSFQDQQEKTEFLRSYTQTYIKEEVQSEGIVRNLQGFRQFLPIVGRENGGVVSYTNVAQDAGISSKTVQSYFEILEDTLLGFFLPAFRRSMRKRQRTHPKFYLFDTGVARAVAQTLTVPLLQGTVEYGRVFEHFWVIEIMRMSAYRKADFTFSYFATQNIEIDLVIERPGRPLLFVEIKSSESVKPRELNALASIVADIKGAEGICISKEPQKRKYKNILVCPWQEALLEIGL